MKLARNEKSLIAWALYFSVLFGSLMCAMGHGQMAAMHMSDLDTAHFCSIDSGGVLKSEHGTSDTMLPASSDCVIASLFCASLLAAFFGLLALLAGESVKPLPRQAVPRSPRERWPLINPRASPSSLPVL